MANATIPSVVAVIRSAFPNKLHKRYMERKSANGFLTDTATTIFKSWRSKTVLEKSYTVAVVLLLITVLPMPYGYYLSMRVGICACLYFYFKEAKTRKDLHPAWKFGLLIFAVLYNPVLPVHLGVRSAWTIINAATVFFLYRAELAIAAPGESTESRRAADWRSGTVSIDTQKFHPATDKDGFDTYRTEFINEVKRLHGKAESDLHWVELCDDEGTRRAYADGIDPKALAAAFSKDGKPPLPHEISD